MPYPRGAWATQGARELAVEQDARANAESRESKEASIRRRAAKSRTQAESLDPDGTSDDDHDDYLPRHRPPVNEDGTPKPEAQRNFTDPDSRIMQDKQGGFSQTFTTGGANRSQGLITSIARSRFHSALDA